MRYTTICFLLTAAMVLPRAAWAEDRWWDTSNGDGLDPGNGAWQNNNNVANRLWAISATPGTTSPTRWNNGDAAFFTASGISSVTVGGDVQVNGITFNGTGYTVGGGSLTLTGPSITTNVTGTINAPLAGTVGLTKLGSSALILGGANTYTGTTAINAGSLVLATGASINNSTTLSVSSGAVLDASAAGLTLTGSQTLRGGGTVHGAVTTSSGSTISPGTSPGILTFAGAGDITLTDGSILEMEVGAPTTPGTTYDQVVVDGPSTKTFTPGSATLKLIGLAGVQTGQDYTIINTQNSGEIATASYFKNLNGTVMDSEATTYSQGGLSFTINYESTFVSVSFSAVPEPSSATLLLLLAPAVGARRKRRA